MGQKRYCDEFKGELMPSTLSLEKILPTSQSKNLSYRGKIVHAKIREQQFKEVSLHNDQLKQFLAEK